MNKHKLTTSNILNLGDTDICPFPIENMSPGEVRVSQHTHPLDFHMNRHVHAFHEIGYVLGGSGWYETPDHVVPVRGGSMLVWSGRVPHKAVDEAGDPLEQVIIMIHDDVLMNCIFYSELSALYGGGEPLVLEDGYSGPGIGNLVRKLSAEARGTRIGKIDIMRALTVELCVAVCRLLSEDRSLISLPDIDPRIENVLLELKSRYYQNQGPDAYARSLGISVRRFSELFKKSTGETFVEYLTGLKMEKAKEFLIESDDKVVNIAFEVGFENLSHFNRTFKKTTGLTPLDFRKMQGRLP